MPGWVDSVSGDLFSLRSGAPGKSQGTGSVDCLVPEGVKVCSWEMLVTVPVLNADAAP